jgi:hypothetical protein
VRVVPKGDDPIPVGKATITGNAPGYQISYKPSDDLGGFIPVAVDEDNEPKVTKNNIFATLLKCCCEGL